MIDKIIKFSVHNKLIILIFTLFIAIAGLYSLSQLTIDAVPDITTNQVQVVTVSPSLAPQEIEQFITYPVEITMSNLQKVEEIRSISRYGLSVVTIVFEEGYDIMRARQLVSEQLQVVSGEIPAELGQPELMPITTGLGEIYQYTVDVEPGYEDQYDARELRSIQDWIVKRQLAGVQGIVEISSFGGFVKQYEVAIDPDKLRASDVTINEIADALSMNNANSGGSYIQKGPYAFYIRSEGLVTTLEDIEKIVVKNNGNVPLLVRDVAKVQFGETPRFGAMTKDGKGEVVGGITLMLKGGNATEVIKNVKDRLTQVEKSLPEGIAINPYLDRATFVDRVIKTVRNNLVEGGLIVIFVLVILLGNVRAGLVVASVIPLAMLFALTLMHMFGVSANLMSLGAIDFGLIVDGAVVIVESIVHHIHTHSNLQKTFTKKEFDHTVEHSASSIMHSATFGMLIILIVYVPIMTLSGTEGKMFKPMAYTVSFAIIGALILSLTYVPMMSALILKRKTSHKKSFADKLNEFILKFYNPFLESALKYRKVVITSALALLVIAVVIFMRMGAVFIPTLEEGDLALQMTIPPGSSLNESINSSTKVESVLLANFPEVKHVVSKIGTAEVPTDPMALEAADVMVILKEKSEWTSASDREELAEKMKEKLGVVKGAVFEFTQPIQLRFNELVTGVKSDVAIKIYGEDLDVLFSKANEVAALVENVQGAADIKVEQVDGLPQIMLRYDREKMARYGLNVDEVNRTVKAAMAGENTGIVFEGERRFDMTVRLEEDFRNDENIYDYLYLRTASGQQIPISEITEIEKETGPMQISRENTQRYIAIGVNVRNRDIQSLVEEMQTIIDQKLDLDPGYFVVFGGQFENLRDATQRLQIAVPLGLLLIFVLLFFAFSSFKQAIMIFSAVPFSAIGGVLGLWVRGMPFSISAGVGFIALFGVAVLNGIVLIGYFNQLKERGIDDLKERILLGASTRLRPVIMTATVASMGFLPMALSTTAGAEVQQPLATVVIFGLFSATMLTLIVLPVIYYLVERGIKKPNKVTMASVLLLFCFFQGLDVNAQVVSTKPQISIEEALQMAVSNNPVYQNAALQIESAEAGKKGIIDFGNTSANYQKGQINSEYNADYNLSINQSFGSPFGFVAKSKMIKSEINLRKSEQVLAQTQLERSVSLTFYQYNWLYYKASLLEDYLKTYEEMVRIADVRLETGDDNMLSSLVISSRKEEINSQLEALKADLFIALKQFNTAIFSEEEYAPQTSESLDKLQFNASDSLQVAGLLNPLYQVYQQQFELSRKKLAVAKTAYSPELSAGIFSQQIDGNGGLNGWQVGVSIPLWFLPKESTVQKAKIESQIASNQLQYQRFRLKAEVEALKQEASKYNSRITYFEETALPRAELITEKSDLLYRQGEIAYYEHIMNLGEANRIKMDYADVLYEYNRVMIEMKYFLAD
ncbi:CusA/CzcA family heavy metal efflux RND transporter [Chondrinema litorale]|uniref:CusA/CzcA family heavy metal efflux RND transporter n=1 Tax=Chondrinema litorale TaxID=2994555 RepID=UPI002542C5E2|nr:CusA/CzcA family heavy metal efflux RND transporter [Chondrinema litorale]UZR93069.1 CusA/CzcA family heavy metal efflux RND transporter [Chondrinema litorale]